MDPTTLGGGFERRLVTYRLAFGESALAAPAPWQILALDVEVSRDAVVGDGAGLFAMSELLAQASKQWELTGVTPGSNGFSTLDYVVRLRAKTARGALLNELRVNGQPDVVGAEFR